LFLDEGRIRGLVESGRLKIEPLFPDTITVNGLDLRIGYEYALPRPGEAIDVSEGVGEGDFELLKVNSNGYVAIPSGSMCLLTTYEYIALPDDLIGLCCLRSSLARYGLYTPNTVIDRGFEGQLVIEAVNANFRSILLPVGTKFLHVVLAECHNDKQGYRGVYRGQRGVKLPKPLRGDLEIFLKSKTHKY